MEKVEYVKEFQIKLIDVFFNGSRFEATYRFWPRGFCPGNAKKIKREFDREPTDIDLINAI